ncbi:MAG: HNH endonuclease [Gemmataceae bacterium]
MDDVLVQLIWDRAKSTCEYCLLPQEFSHLTFELDHVIATCHGGPTRASNLALSCFYCNRYKGPNIAGLDPPSKKISPLFHPRRHKWNRHFRYDGPILMGLTPKGRATIAVLQINQPEAVALREALIDCCA